MYLEKMINQIGINDRLNGKLTVKEGEDGYYTIEAFFRNSHRIIPRVREEALVEEVVYQESELRRTMDYMDKWEFDRLPIKEKLFANGFTEPMTL